MDAANVESFTKLLQLSVSPVVLISGVGLLLLSVTNRLGRAIDRSRVLANELDNKEMDHTREGREQLRIMIQRAGYLRISVSGMVASIFFSCVMILTLTMLLFAGFSWEGAVLTSFCLSLLSLLISLGYLLMDIFWSLKALKFEVARHL